MQSISKSITPDTYPQLLTLRDRLAEFQTIQCKMAHEQVKEIFDGTATNNPENLTVKRMGLCDITRRRKWLGCAHTIANNDFANLLSTLYDTGALQMASSPSIMLNDLIMKIYHLDHEKGNLEKQKALAKYMHNTEEATKTQEAIQDIISKHKLLIAELEQFRCEVLRQIDVAIENQQSVS